ncbi:MAG: glucosaminidase domain-containing protein [Alphaproteobacteria bacterium]|nr:glucosaminidase domain-containing protein [Alphaproteobacteria bacterium]
MKKIYIITSLILFSLSIHIKPLCAQIKTTKLFNITYVENATVQELEEVFKAHKYKRFRALDDDAYPAIFVKTLPIDFQEITSQKYRNELFIRILCPIALKINEEIENERNQLLLIEKSYVQNKSLTPTELEKLEFLSNKYDYFTKEKGTQRAPLQIENLKLRIERIPPSILIAIAALESNWGFSRPAKLANSLYKEKVWHTTEGLEPLEDKDDGYRFKIFDSLMESMRSYALTFNSNINYSTTWISRKETMKRQDNQALGDNIAHSLSLASNLPNYMGILEYTIAFYDLFAVDIGHLKREE